MVDADEYARIRLALVQWPDWTVHWIGIDKIDETDTLLPERAVALCAVQTLLELGQRPFRIPVLGITPIGMFDVAPAALCDDLIGDNWTAAELRYRLSRLTGGRLLFAGEQTLACTPSQLTSGGCRVRLTSAQYRLMALLIRAHGEPVPREALVAVIPASDSAVSEGRALDMHISRLRKKLRLVAATWNAPPQITAHRGSGYALV